MSDSASPTEYKERPDKHERQRAWWVRYLAYLGIILTVLAAIFAFFDVRGRLRWEAHVAEIEASGGSLDVRNLIEIPATPDCFWNDPFVQAVIHDNYPDLNLNYGSILDGDREFSRGKDFAIRLSWLSGSSAPLEEYFPGVTGMTREEAARRILDRMEPFEAILPDLQQAAARPASGFPLEALSDRELLDSSWSLEIAQLGQLGLLRTSCLLATGQEEEALDQLLLVLRLAGHIEQDAQPSDLWQAQFLKRSALQPTWEGLHDRAWDETQLRRLEAALAEATNPGISFETLLAKERWSMATRIELSLGSALSRARLELFQGFSLGGVHLWEPGDWMPEGEVSNFLFELGNRIVVISTPKGVILGNPIHQDCRLQETLLNPALTLKQRIDAEQAAWEALALAHWRSPSKAFFSEFVGPHGQTLKFMLETQQWLESARAAVAAERFRLAEGRVPGSWSELVPGWLPAVPGDIWTGGSLLYRLDPEGQPMIYSVGENGIDDGGRYVSRTGKGDLVWRYSPTPPLPPAGAAPAKRGGEMP